MKRTFNYLLLISLILTACGSTTPAPTQETIIDPMSEVSVTIELSSPAFTNGQPIPDMYTCQGEDISPLLSWAKPPEGTQSFALIMDDPDAQNGTWVHWVIFNIPSSSRGLAQATPPDATFSYGAMSGNNSWGRTGYGGPCPPSGTHRYFFKLYALDEVLAIEPGSDKGELEKAMFGHILAQAELMGTYSK